jgi:16S rRNA (guanine966-N2)-methyltransferase
MRVVGGKLRGRTLTGPKSQTIRPTADRLRESLFNILVHAYGDPVTDARVLDLFAGTGALGIEALSHGAAFALLVDDGAEARALLRENTTTLGLGGVTKIYGQNLAEKALASARAGGWFTADALVVVEEATKSAFAAPEGFSELERRRYDDTEFAILRAVYG